LLYFGVTQAQWTSPAGSNTYTFDNVGIDTSVPSSKLTINAGSSRGFDVYSNWGNTHIPYSKRITQAGNVGIGMTAPAYKLDVNGDLRVRGNDILGYSGNFRITAGSGGFIDLQPKDASYGIIVREYNSSDYAKYRSH